MDINRDKLLNGVILNPDDLEELKVGYVVKGVVTANFNDFSYVTVADLHCVLPISEVSYDPKPKNPKVGTAIEAVVIRISEEQGIMLSIKGVVSNQPTKFVKIPDMRKRNRIFLVFSCVSCRQRCKCQENCLTLHTLAAF